ncbi:MAG TPA: ABC transporter ATP-binding protein [Armatimonadota bacterium]|jgi:ABC-2 type transport system ATP-binding protein
MPEELAISAVDVRKSFGGRVAVDGLTLDTPRGEVFGLVGPDGAGKTTAFRLMCGVLLPDSGSLRVAGHDVVAEPEEVKRRIGYLSQGFSQYVDMTVWENLEFTAALYGVAEGEWQERADELMNASRMTAFKDRLAGNLSGGMKQKLALSCTLLHTPEVVFLDEPTTGVDPVSRRDFWSILYDLPRRGVTIVVSTPYMDEAERCRRVAFLLRGRIIACGTPGDLKARAGGGILVFNTDQPRAARDALSERGDVLESVLFGDHLHVLAADPAASEPVLTRALEAAGIRVLSVAPSEPGLEDIFVHMAGRSAS